MRFLFLFLGALLFAAPASAQGYFVASGFDQAVGLVQLSDGRVLITDRGAGTIRAYASDGAFLGTFASIANPWGITQLADGRVLVTRPFEDEVLAFGADGSPLGLFASGPVGYSITQLTDGRVLFAGGGVIRAVQPDGTELAPFATGLTAGVSLAPYQLADGRVLVTDYRVGLSGSQR